MSADATVEWGDERPVGWLDRLLGEPDQSGRRRLSAPALGAAVLSGALLLAAQLSPWMVLSGPIINGVPAREGESDVHLDQAGQISAIAFQLGVLVLFGFVGAALVARPAARRVLTAAGAGWGFGLFTVVVGLGRSMSDGGRSFGEDSGETAVGPGVFFAGAGVLVAVVALVLSGWQPGRSARHPAGRAAEPDVDVGPTDLTVTPLQ